MRHITLIIAVIALALAAPAFSEMGGNGNGKGGGNGDGSGAPGGNNGSSGPLEATIVVAAASRYLESASGPVVAGDVTFGVTRSKPTDEVLWVTNTCVDAAGNVAVRTTTASIWGSTESLEGSAGPLPTAGVRCVAYVTLHPWHDQPLKDAVVGYDVIH